MSYLSEVNARRAAKQAPRRSMYPQWGMDEPRQVSTGRYRGDTGMVSDLYLIRPHGWGLLSTGMTVADLAVGIAAGAFAAVWLWLIGQVVGIGIDNFLDKMGY